ncbi:MAG: hypothetical protein H8D55_03000 [Deltaproteobacteria bacterium]|nr:hypothetical protein [Deltaproteobacteria bacterium]
MTGLFTNKDGRLKTGRVAILIFAGLLMALVMLFKVNSSVDHTLLAVKHVFEPQEVQPIKEKPAVKQAIARVEPAKDKEAEQKRERLSDETRTEEKKKVELEKDPVPEETARNDEKFAKAQPPAEDAAKLEPKTKSPVFEKPNTGQEIEKTLAEAAKTKPSDNHIVFDKAGLAKIARKSSEEAPEEQKSETINLSEKINRLTATSKQPIEKKQSEPSKPMASLPKKTFLDAHPDKREITVDKKQYKTLFHSWRIAGKGGKGEEKTPLRVENLRNTYDLFQMKPVAVIRGNAFLDLSDGTRVPEKSLEEYSSTVFLVDRPWDKWSKALSAAGIRRGDRFEVRYYMYDFIRDAIYARVNQAFSWCSDTGLIPGDLPAGEVDVLGRAYVINRQGGGRFGVFVPVSLDTKDGRTVAVDPACFRGQPDVETLREAGVL